MIVGIIVALFGLGAVALGALQVAGALPAARRRGGLGNLSGYLNIAIGILLVALGALRIKGLV
jgi:uncharacterized membrane protein YidH (DUF202 family)